MGLSWQQGPLAHGAIGRFLTAEPLPERMPFAEPLRRRMRVRFGGEWIADSENVLLLHEPGRYPVAYFPVTDVTDGVLDLATHTTSHRDFGQTAWYSITANGSTKDRAAYEHIAVPAHASVLNGRIAFAWRAVDGFYEEDERIVGHAADPYHRIDIRDTSRHLTVHHDGRVIADTTRPLALYESGFAPRWYVPREDVTESALTPVENRTFCPYKGICGYFDIGDARLAAWTYEEPWPEVRRVGGLMSFEADKVEVRLDGVRLHLEPGQSVVPHGIDRDLSLDEVAPARQTSGTPPLVS
ncbi:DUF427 domain-containing protein [Amycolatopsis rhabdoformis]|uniref:DUF427 domain-containing protein n=1 Tax=Amycolatopsis rhabdoformis TaxID=1448059 RepID=A0ABZ1IF60_9PSEU|nr:DUF427 domain-containing protein [Amycolatopsis rhabdoformis]WSE33042.1 DUF427 domain-containing protein [Amycolatopsis rhabdoformis]